MHQWLAQKYKRTTMCWVYVLVAVIETEKQKHFSLLKKYENI